MKSDSSFNFLFQQNNGKFFKLPIIDCISVYFIHFLKNKFNYIFFLSFFIFKLGASQDYAYKNYTTKDGLAGNHVYHSVQDKEGYLWFATETGVSRFDGKNFVNFTVEQGLPSNEILKMFVDSKGRVWMMPFANQICYYYNGKIYNSKNDSTLKRIHIKDYICNMVEDFSGNLFFLEPKENLLVISKANKIYNYLDKNLVFYNLGLGQHLSPQVFISNNLVKKENKTELFDISFKNNNVILSKVKNQFSFWGDKISEIFIGPNIIVTPNRKSLSQSAIKLEFYIKNIGQRSLPRKKDFNNFVLINDSICYVNSKSGSISHNIYSSKRLKTYLINEDVSFCIKDIENNLWFTTINHGIFKLCYNDIINLYSKNNSKKNLGISSVAGVGNCVFAGNSQGDFFKINRREDSWFLKKVISINNVKGGKQKFRKKQDDLIFHDQLEFGTFNQNENYKIKSPNYPFLSLKDFDIDKYGNLFIAYHSGACKAKILKTKNKYQISEYVTFFNDRTTSIAVGDSINFLGTITGIKCFNPYGTFLKTPIALSNLKYSISCLNYHDGLLWIGTSQNGLICFDGKGIVKNITVKDGLPENSIRCLYLDNKKLWVGTNKGITEIAFEKLNNIRVARNFNNDEGLISNVVNDIYTANDSIYVATEEGLSIITDLQPKQTGVCILNTPIVRVASKIVSAQNVSLNPSDDIQFEYTGISFRSEGDISYKYRLLGIDSLWKITNQRFIYYSFLPNGNYNLQLLAVNKFGIKSKLINVPFRVNKRLYEENYFRIIICLIIISLISLLFKKRNQVNQKKYLQKLQNAQKIMSLEQEALKAQMNPHFIFNCLNAIQYFIIEKDVISANKFISSFAGLIRQALDNSGRKSISIEEEITFLKSFIEIEQNRFEDRFLYQINVSDDIETDLLQIPPMLVQPFVENAINHGLLHKKNGIGKLEIYFSLSEEMLKIIISDNGIGRTASRSLSNHVELLHVSKGIALTEMRISRLNFSETNKIKLAIEDQYDNNGNPIGTKVEILIPLIFDN